MIPTQFTNFEEAFSSGTHGSRRTCACGREFYDAVNSWSWDEGEKDALFADKNATGCDYAVGGVVVDGVEYCNACSCWHDKAARIIAWLDAHRHSVASFFSREKIRKQMEADEAPTLG